MALCLKRSVGEEIIVKGPTGEEIWIKIAGMTIAGKDVLGNVDVEVIAPGNYEVDRREVYEKKQQQRRRRIQPP
jgi:sRNA-binding carbon storage regulator CsrA